jgi:hypothetical protein
VWDDKAVAVAYALIVVPVVSNGIFGRWVPLSCVHSASMTCGWIPLMPIAPATTTTAASKIFGPIVLPASRLKVDILCRCALASYSERIEFGRICTLPC